MFTRVSLPTPFQVGPVNAYVAGRTVVDPGPDSEEAWTRLLEALGDRNIAPEDVEQVLVTHPHPDHFGAAARLRERGARVRASPAAAAIVGDFRARLDREQAYFTDFFERCGMARETAETVTALPEAFLAYAESVAVDRELSDGDALTVADERVDVGAVAGHAPGELIFGFDERRGHDGTDRADGPNAADRADGSGTTERSGSSTDSTRRTALVGDHVLADITPNPFLQPPASDGGPRPRVLPAYNDSLASLAEEPFDRFRPGHRDPIDAPVDRIEAILAEHEARTSVVAELVDGPTTPVDVMEGLFGDLPATEQFSGMSEAVGHLDVLEERGLVEQRERGGVVVYARAENEP